MRRTPTHSRHAPAPEIDPEDIPLPDEVEENEEEEEESEAERLLAEAHRAQAHILKQGILNITERAPKDPPDSSFARFIRGKGDYIGQHFERDNADSSPYIQPSVESGNAEPSLSPEKPSPPPELKPEPTEPEPAESEESEDPTSLGQAILRYGTPGEPEYSPEYNPNNPEYAQYSPKRRRKIVKRLLIEDGLMLGTLPEKDPHLWPSAEDGHENPHRKGRHEPYPEGTDRTGMGNPYGQRAYTEHPDGLSINEVWLQIMNHNLTTPPHEKLEDDDIVTVFNAIFPRNRPRTRKDIGEMRSLFNSGRIPHQHTKPLRQLMRFVRLPVNPDKPQEGYEVFEASARGGIRKCITNPQIRVIRGAIPKTPADRPPPRSAFPFPAQAPFWFKWWEGRIVTPEEYERRKFEKEKAEWEAAHPGEKFETDPFEELEPHEPNEPE